MIRDFHGSRRVTAGSQFPREVIRDGCCEHDPDRPAIKGAHSLKLSLQDWIWTFVWPIGGVAAGAVSLGELLRSDQYHPWGPLLGMILSGVGILTWWATKGVAKLILGILAFLGAILNLVAGVLVIVALTR